MYKRKTLVFILSVFASVGVSVHVQARNETFIVKGVVLDANLGTPLAAVQISSPDIVGVALTEDDGTFKVIARNASPRLKSVKRGWFTTYKNVPGRTDSVTIFMQDAHRTLSPESFFMADHEILPYDKSSNIEAVDTRNLGPANTVFSDALAGKISSLNVTRKSGMPGEGSVVSLRGLRSLISSASPLVVVDGVPMLPGEQTSMIINGYSYDVLESIDINNVDNVTFLRGIDAMEYGSMGSNGVLLVTTQRGNVSKTKVEFKTVDGVSFANGRIPLMSGMDYVRYISEIASTRYTNTEDIVAAFPFLGSDMSYADKVKYGFNTDWQSQIYSPAWNTANSLKVRGGDEIVQYLVTAGYQGETGVLNGTRRDKFNTTGNTSINFSEKFKAYAAVSFDYVEQSVMEQGMCLETNPILTAYSSNPLTGVYAVDANGGIMTDFAKIDNVIMASNPAAVVSDVEAKNKVYDFNVSLSLRYNFLRNLYADVKFGLFYKYLKDDIFVAGYSGAIAPLYNGLALNTVRSGSTEFFDYYVKGLINYDFLKNGHALNLSASYQLISSSSQSSNGIGINTTTDRYKTLTDVSSIGRQTGGYADVFNWMGGFVKADYNYRHMLYAAVAAQADAASTYGTYTGKVFFFPAASLAWNIASLPALSDNGVLSRLMLRTQYSINSNSRYSGALSRYYYSLSLIKDISGLVRAGIPGKYLGPEKVHNIDAGIDLSLYGDKLSLSADFFVEDTRDMIVAVAAKPEFGFPSVYENSGAMNSKGIDLGISATLVDMEFQWRVGGNMSFCRTLVTSLGGADSRIIDMGNGLTLINKVGYAPYSFYGYQSEGVFSTSEAARDADLRTVSGYTFAAGDIKFRDMNGDHVINDSDRTVLGRQLPDLSGALYSNMTWRGFTLFANFTFRHGNMVYNGTRRFVEAESGFGNQALSVNRRWVTEGQQTDIPRASYGDPAGNNRFSSRWIEDGSFIKLRELTLSWETDRKLWLLNGLKVFVTGENLFSFTKYTGGDPEFAFSYDPAYTGLDFTKVCLPKTARLGLVLNF